MDPPVPSEGRTPRPHTDDWQWQLRAACRSHDPETFFHPVTERGPGRAERERRAKSICAACPVLLACRDHALRAGEAYGIWGGLSEAERAAMQDRDGARVAE